MGALLGRNKNEESKGFFSNRFCPRRSSKSHEKSPGKIKNEEKIESPSKKMQWSEVQLQVPESLLDIENQVVNEPPVPPPRKKSKSNTLERKENAKLLMNADKVPEIQIERVPVEEPLIVPRKEPVHICDGTHSHVTNIVNGKVIHSHCIKSKQVKEVEKPAPARPKFASTVSLPDIAELNQENIKAKSKVSRKKPQKQISVISLPTDGQVKLSDTTAARLENYLRRCKNFNGLPPKQLLEDLQLNDHNSDSDDSWDGLNGWGMNVLEYHGMPLKSPVEPRSRLAKPSPVVKPVEEVKKTVVDRLKDITERRESIDDFFDAKAESLYPNELNVPNILPERRDSDSFFPSDNDKDFYASKIYDDASKLKSDIFYTNALLESESRCYRMPEKPKKPEIKNITTIQPEPAKIEVPEVKLEKGLDLNDKDLIETFQEFYETHKNYKSSETIAKEDKKQPENDTKPKRKFGNVEHSNLLKIIQDNSKSEENTDTSQEGLENIDSKKPNGESETKLIDK